MDDNWQYLRIYLAGFDEVPTVLRQAVRPWLDRHSDIIDRWFFIQYIDEGGPHLRIRYTASGDDGPLRADLQDAAWTACSELPARRGERHVVRRHYGPELTKFPGGNLELAHRIAHIGSEAALALVEERARIPTLAQATAHLLAVHRSLDDLLPSTFLYQYGWYWTGRGSIGKSWQHVVAQRRNHPDRVRSAARRAYRTADTVLNDPHCGRILRTYAQDVADLIRSTAPVRPAHPTTLTVHHHLHLMNNRLGALPLQEAYAARLLSFALDEQQHHQRPRTATRHTPVAAAV